MKRVVIGMLLGMGICLGSVVSVLAVDEEVKTEKDKNKTERVDITLIGKITKVEKKGRGDKAFTQYILTDAEGTQTRLPQAEPAKRKNKAGEQVEVIKLADYLDVQVKVLAQAKEIEKDGKKTYHVVRIKSIEKVEEKVEAEVEETVEDETVEDEKVEDETVEE